MTLNLSKTQTLSIEKSEDIAFSKFLNSENIDSEITLNYSPEIKNKVSLKFVLDNSSKLNLKVLIKIPACSIEVETFLKFDVMLLDSKSYVNITPALEIQENNVKVGHAASIRKFNQEEIYYLQSRGIELNLVKELLIEAFLK